MQKKGSWLVRKIKKNERGITAEGMDQLASKIYLFIPANEQHVSQTCVMNM